jgi:hypothetical protein
MLQLQTVTVDTFRGPMLLSVVEDLGDVLALTTPEEVDSARRDGRAPLVVGFKKADVITFYVDRTERTKHNGQYESIDEGAADPGGVRPR